MGLIEGNSDSIAHLILDEADLEFSGFTMTVGNQQKWDTFVKERSGGNGCALGLP
jgi:hypothetical protein